MRKTALLTFALWTTLAFLSSAHAGERGGAYAHRYHSWGKNRISVTQAKYAAAVAVAKSQGIPLTDKQLRRIEKVELTQKVSADGMVLFRAKVAVPADSPMARLAAKLGSPIPTMTVFGKLDTKLNSPSKAEVDKLAYGHYERRRSATQMSDWFYAENRIKASGKQPNKATVRRAAKKEYNWRIKANALADTLRAEHELAFDLNSGSRATIMGSSPKQYQNEMKRLNAN